MFEKGLYRPAFFLFWYVKALRFGFFNHDANRSAAQAFGPGEDCGTVWVASTSVVWVEPGGGLMRLGGGGVSSIAWETSSVTSRVAFLNSLMPWPKPLANSGSFLAPKSIRMTARM